MAVYTITAYQEMFAEHNLESESAEQAADLFRKLAEEDGVSWRKGDEALDIADISVEGESVDIEE